MFSGLSAIRNQVQQNAPRVGAGLDAIRSQVQQNAPRVGAGLDAIRSQVEADFFNNVVPLIQATGARASQRFIAEARSHLNQRNDQFQRDNGYPLWSSDQIERLISTANANFGAGVSVFDDPGPDGVDRTNSFRRDPLTGTSNSNLTQRDPLTGTSNTPLANPDPTPLNLPMTRFHNTLNQGSYLFAGPSEADSVRNLPHFHEDGFAFAVAASPENDPLLKPFIRYVDTAPGRIGNYLYVAEPEAASIDVNNPNFVKQGVAFYAYYESQGSSTTNFHRFVTPSGAYFFAGDGETSSILSGLPASPGQIAPNGFTYQGVAFAAGG